jgi:hypothetical protein
MTTTLEFWGGRKSSDDLDEIKQDRQCTYNETLWRVRVTIVALEK